MPYYITNGRIRFGTFSCKGVRNADNVYISHQEAQSVLDEVERKGFYDKLSAGNNLCKRALTHIHHLNTEIVVLKLKLEKQNAGEN